MSVTRKFLHRCVQDRMQTTLLLLLLPANVREPQPRQVAGLVPHQRPPVRYDGLALFRRPGDHAAAVRRPRGRRHCAAPLHV
jgi:hypothetical protein